jgi:prepilin-type N-terminal cleavage/methylation domain-containing protein
MDDHTASSTGQRHGFTLIELVVTITLLGIVLASAALLGRHAVNPIRNMSRAAGKLIQIQNYAYLTRRIDEIAVLLSWSDTTLRYLDEQGNRKEIFLTRYSWGNGDICCRIALEPSGNRPDQAALDPIPADVLLQTASSQMVRLRIWNTSETTPVDTLLYTRRVAIRQP